MPELIISMNTLQEATRGQIASYLEANPKARHLDAPMLDVLPQFQNALSHRNATRALHATREALLNDRTVVVHCLMGIHRSVSIAAVALAGVGLVSSPREAFLTIQSRRHIAGWIPETVEWLEGIGTETETRAS